jgi:PadR family transcriptional regulator, regulatory protein AphA
MSLPYMLLGLLDGHPMSGYDLNKAFNTTVQHFWTTEQSQIYRALHKLEADGWLTVETVIQQDSPNKKLYHITAAGRDALHQWLATPLPEEPAREAWIGQLFFGHLTSNEVVISVLESYVAQLRQRLAALEALQATVPGDMPLEAIPRQYQFQFLTLDYGLELHRFELQWALDAIERIRQFPRDSTNE